MENNRVLCLVAHCDDEILSFGGLLQRLIKQGKEIQMTYLVVGGRNPRQNTVIRMHEAYKVCKKLGIPKDHVEFLFKNKDAEMDTIPLLEIASKIENRINSYKPDLLLTQLSSFHQDHKRLFDAVQIALRLHDGFQIKNVLLGEYPFMCEEVNMPFNGKVYLSMTKEELEGKRELLSYYDSQLKNEPSVLGLDAMVKFHELRGMGHGCKYAERYFLLRGEIS